MSGTILENLSNKKLSIVLSIILVIQLISFFIGAFIAPAPSSTEQVTATKCITENPKELAIPRAVVQPNKIQAQNCRSFEETMIGHSNITFAFQLPLPREGFQLDYSRWQQNLLTILVPDVMYDNRMSTHRGNNNDEYVNSTIRLNVRLAVRNIGDKNWKMYANKYNLKRTISCKIEANKRIHGYKYDCDLIQLFELQSLFYDYYLINLQFADSDNDLGAYLSDLQLVEIHQNGGFTKIWLFLKSVFTFITLLTLLWFSKRLGQLHRETTLLEKTLIVLGCAITQLNIPVEFLSLWFDIKLMSFLCDLRQGIFHCALLSFWIIFIGEHLLDGIHRSRLSSYYKQLSIVLVAYMALFVFDLSERGIQWFDPFFTIWEVDSRFALIFIITASIASIGYFAFLCYHIWIAFRNISTKQTTLPSMSSTRRLIYQGIIYRFKFLLLATLVCAAATVVAYLMGQVTEDQWYWDDMDNYIAPLQWTSAMFTTVYALWNCYVLTLLILYAPSHKELATSVDSMSEEIEFNRLTENEETTDKTEGHGSTSTTESNDMRLLQQLATKSSID
ncbi:protein wntless-like [Oppia nitens]|uniref:protein wntless-like n=1 Tax=Oppia nitens TaxID=1686743 RepID=UPI0023D9B36C|nr:protein wntless-like [Oppia nitens]